MATWNNNVITNAGRSLIADCQAHSKALNITTCVLSSHNYTGTLLANLTDLEDIEQTVNINEKSVNNDTYKLTANFDNTGLLQGYQLYTCGVYANNGDEDVLLLVATTNNPDPVPAIADGLWQALINSNITISGDVNVTINVDLSADASIQYVDNSVNEVRQEGTELKSDIKLVITYPDATTTVNKARKETIIIPSSLEQTTSISDGQTLETYEVSP